VLTFLKIIAHGCAVGWTLSRHFLFQAILGRSGSARALRPAFESLGVNWVRLGQALALRFDVLPADLCRELLSIRNDIKPFGYAEVRRIIEQEFGRTPEHLFESFDETPFAITSSGQLHKAITLAGEHLVVKVQREETSREFRVQSAIMRVLGAFFDAVGAFGTTAFSRAVADFLQQRASELSFAAAATNARKMTSLAEGDPLELNIRICSEYTGQRVLSWEFINGISVGTIIGSTKASAPWQLNDPSEREYDFDRIARQIYRNALNQIFRDGTFHADISAAGLLVLPTGSIAYVDFAVVGRLDDERQRLLQAHYECLLQGQIDESVEKLIECADLPSSFEHTEFRRSLAIILEDRLDGFQSPVGSLPRTISQNTYLSLMSAFREQEVALPGDLSLYFRTMLTIESLIFELCPGFDPVAEQSRFFSLAVKQDYRQSWELPQAIEHMARLYHDAVELVSDLRRLHNSAQAIEVSLRTLRIRLLQYGFWAVLAAACTYFGFRDETLQQTTALQPFLLPGAFLFVALFLLSRLWRQSRQLSRVDRAIVSTGEVSRRSLGRVR
jgi:ubiquinone biosynthesis protein